MKRFISLILCFVFIICLSACSKKELSSNDLQSKLTGMGYGVTEITTQIEAKNVKKAYAANNGKYQMEIYIFPSEADAKEAYKSNKATFIELYKEESKEKKKDSYEHFYQETKERFNTLSRVGKTVVYVSSSIEYEDDVKKAINKLGY